MPTDKQRTQYARGCKDRWRRGVEGRRVGREKSKTGPITRENDERGWTDEGRVGRRVSRQMNDRLRSRLFGGRR